VSSSPPLLSLLLFVVHIVHWHPVYSDLLIFFCYDDAILCFLSPLCLFVYLSWHLTCLLCNCQLLTTITVDEAAPGLKTILSFRVPDQRSGKVSYQILLLCYNMNNNLSHGSNSGILLILTFFVRGFCTD